MPKFDMQGCLGRRKDLPLKLRDSINVHMIGKLTIPPIILYIDDPTDSTAANLYGDIEADIDLSAIVEQAQRDQDLTQEERDDFIALNNWLGLVSPNAYPGTINVKAPGYSEKELADYNTFSAKASAGLYYRFKNNIEASLTYKFGLGTAIYQASNRYSINNILFQQGER